MKANVSLQHNDLGMKGKFLIITPCDWRENVTELPKYKYNNIYDNARIVKKQNKTEFTFTICFIKKKDKAYIYLA